MVNYGRGCIGGCNLCSFFSRSYAGGYPEGGGNGGEYGNEDVEDFPPEVFVFHVFLDLELILVIVIQSEAKNLNASTLCITFVYSDSSSLRSSE